MRPTSWTAALGAAWMLMSCDAWGAGGSSSFDKASPPPAKVSAGVSLAVFAKKLSEPVFLTYAPGDKEKRIFVVEKTGKIIIFTEGKQAKTPFLDLSKLVSRGGEQGLLGLAFHPKYAENGRLFVHYTDSDGNTRVVEYKADAKDPSKADPASARELLFVEQPYSNHNGGHLAFGPDGKLYIGLGDGGSANDPKNYAQNDKSQLGKMLLIDVDASKPKAETIMKGLRNPWRYSFDRKTGDLYIGDVGQGDFEEIDYLPAGDLHGKNLGWKVMEGLHCFKARSCSETGLTPPIMEYSHKAGCSITGGYVYRGKALPALVGHYFYADYCTGLVRSLRVESGKATDHWEWRPLLDPEETLASLSSFGEDAEGELYLLSLDGVIYKFVKE